MSIGTPTSAEEPDRQSGHSPSPLQEAARPSYASDRGDGVARRSTWRRDQRQGDTGFGVAASSPTVAASEDRYGWGGFPQTTVASVDLDADYIAWRDQQLAAYDEDYLLWRETQMRRHDEDYRRWRHQGLNSPPDKEQG